MNILKSLKFLFFRLSAFLFDMLTLSFIMAVTLTIVFSVVDIGKDTPLDVIFKLSINNSIFKTLLYLAIIGFYYGIHVYFRRATLGLWITHQDFAEKIPEIAKEKSADADMLGNDKGEMIKGALSRMLNSFMYSSFQMINVAFLGILTIMAAFKERKVPYHEGVSGIYIVSRKKG